MKRYICKEKIDVKRTRIKIISKEGRIRVGVEHIGIAHNETELKMLLALSRERLRDKHQEEFKFKEFEEEKENKIIQKRTYSKYLYDTLSEVYNRIGIKEIEDEIFRKIIISRVIRPASKHETIEILEDLGLESPTDIGIWRSLRRCEKLKYRQKISEEFIKISGINRASILLYDVTTLYFEVEREDEYRKSGLSKERRLEPQIVIGLLVDEQGFPLGISSFEGNKAETKTMLPVLKEFRERCKAEELTVVADAAMMSGENLDLLEAEGFKFIIGSRLAKTPYEIEEYRKVEKEELSDGQTFETAKVYKNKQNAKECLRRVVYQYRKKRAELDLRNIDKQIRKAQKQIDSKAFTKKPKFLKLTQTSAELDENLIKEVRLKAGVKGYVTNLNCAAQIIINGYHNLFNVEKSFRMTKSDLKARPIFHRLRDSIEAHLTVCFAALGICRYIQDRTKLSIKRFVRRLERLRTGIIQIANKEHIAEPEIDAETQTLVNLLK